MPDLPFFTLKSHDHPIPDDLARELAGVVIKWSVFENAIVLDTDQMMKFPAVRALATEAPRSFKRKIELWKRAIHTRFADNESYKNVASEICSQGKSVAQHRHQLIHGHWLLPEKPGDPFVLWISEPLDHFPAGSQIPIDVRYVAGVHQSLKKLGDLFWGFNTTRMLHGRRRGGKGGRGHKP
jgi:hypothetical protein